MSSFASSSGSSAIDEARRSAAERKLMEAFTDGRIREADFERRYQQAVRATTQSELEESLAGVPSALANPLNLQREEVDDFPAYPGTKSPYADPPPYESKNPYGPGAANPYGSSLYDSEPSYRSSADRGVAHVPYGGATGRGASTAMAAVAHFSGLLTSVFGPVLIYALTRRGTDAHREAAKAFNFQLLSLLALIGSGILGAILPNAIDNIPVMVVTLVWFIGTIVGGARAAQGDDWKNPVLKVTKFGILPEK